MITQKTISIPQDLWSEIDQRRGDIPRSRFIARILADALRTSKGGKRDV